MNRKEKSFLWYKLEVDRITYSIRELEVKNYVKSRKVGKHSMIRYDPQ